jgi:hypothetical protein
MSDKRLHEKVNKHIRENGDETKIEFILKEIEYHKLNFYKEDMSQ